MKVNKKKIYEIFRFKKEEEKFDDINYNNESLINFKYKNLNKYNKY